MVLSGDRSRVVCRALLKPYPFVCANILLSGNRILSVGVYWEAGLAVELRTVCWRPQRDAITWNAFSDTPGMSLPLYMQLPYLTRECACPRRWCLYRLYTVGMDRHITFNG
jgi:hypothetical protein